MYKIKNSILLIKSFVFLILILNYLQPCFAELSPNEILIIANSNRDKSYELAKFYAAARNIPNENIIQLKTSTNFSITRKDFENHIANPIKQSLITSNNLKRIKAIVLMYGIPLKIDEIIKPLDQEALINVFKEESKKLASTIQTDFKEIQALELKYVLSLNHVFKNINDIEFLNLPKLIFELYSKIKIVGNPEETKADLNKLIKINTNLFGINSPTPLNNNAPDIKKITKIKESLSQLNNDISQINSEELRKIIDANKTLNGSAGALNGIKFLNDRILGIDTSASIDSELSTLWLFPLSSPISGRLPNPFYAENKLLNKNLSYPFLMVSRLDAANPEIVQKNISDAISVENEKKYEGKFLIDSRGFGFDKVDEYGKWDRKLVALAKKEFGDQIEIDFDGNPNIADKTKDIILYTGWYQLRNYQDNYSFKKGAVGYHIASEEAINIHDASEKGWCKNLLDRGVVATIGAVEEPYLDSFADPELFFPLLASGRYSLIDAYYLSTKYISWRQILFGDPLYKPFQLDANAIDEDDIDFTLPKAPSDLIRSADYFTQ